MNAVWMPMIMLANPMMQVDSTLMNERVEDVAFVDQESEKRNQELPNCTYSVENNGYTSEAQINIQCTGNLLDQSTLIIEHNKQTEFLQAQTEMTYLCKDAGTYFAYIQCQDRKGDIQTWHYMDEKSQINRIADEDDTKKAEENQPLQSSVPLYENANTGVNYTVESVVQEESQYQLPVPMKQQSLNNVSLVEPESFHLENQSQMEKITGNETDFLLPSTIDDFGNESMTKKIIAEDGTVKTEERVISQTLTPNLEVQNRTWIVEDQQQIHLQQKSQQLSTSSFQIITMENRLVRVVFGPDEKIVWIKINGKKIQPSSIGQDRMHHSYVEFRVLKKKCIIEVKMKDSSGQARKVKKIIHPVLTKRKFSKSELWFQTLWLKWLHG